MKLIRTLLLFVSVVVLLAACGPSATEEPAPFIEEGKICAANPDGQGVYSGKNPKSQSLLMLGIPHGFLVYNEVQKQIEQFVEAPTISIASTNNVVILVIDVFSVMEVEEAATPEPEIEAPDVGEFNASYPGHDWLKRIDYWETPAGSFTLVAVETDELNTNSILQNMESAISLFTSTGEVDLGESSYPSADQVVVNMSFGYVPCDPMPYIRTSLNDLGLGLTDPEMESLEKLREIYDDKNSSLYAYVTDWSSDHASLFEQLNQYPDPNNAQFEAFITWLTYSPDNLIIDGDAFDRFKGENGEWLDKVGSQFDQLTDAYPDVVFIGAAGNFELPYPFYPAAVGPAISVSSTGMVSDSEESCRSELADYSNCGEVKLDGVFFDETGNDTGIEGTSFAAPEFSFWMALYLLGNQLCPLNGNELSGGLVDLNNATESSPWVNYDFPSTCLP